MARRFTTPALYVLASLVWGIFLYLALQAVHP